LILLASKTLPSGEFFFSTHSLYLRAIINHKSIKMKKIIFVTLLFTFSNILSGQVAVASFVHLEKGVEKDYNTLEKIWMPFHNSEIKAGKKMFWAVWKIDKAPEMEKAPDYVVFNIFKDEKQLNTYRDNWDSDSSRKKIESLNRGKYSKSVVKNIMNKKIKNEVRSYTIKILHQTVMTGGDTKIGDKISMGAMRQKSDDYEKFEMNVFLPMWEQQLLKGKISQWSFAKVIDKNEAANDVTHMTFIFRNNANPQDVMFMPENEWLSNMIVQQGLATREFWSSEATLVYMSN